MVDLLGQKKIYIKLINIDINEAILMNKYFDFGFEVIFSLLLERRLWKVQTNPLLSRTAYEFLSSSLLRGSRQAAARAGRVPLAPSR